MPRPREKDRSNLTEGQLRTSNYMNQLIIGWQQKDLFNRAMVTNIELARLISQYTKKKLSSITIGAWRMGDAVPSRKNAEAVARFFEVPLNDVLIAFGYVPQMTFARFYEIAKEAADTENWEDKGEILGLLKQTLNPNWENFNIDNEQWRIQIAQTILLDDAPLHQRARLIAYLAEAEEEYRQRSKHATEG